MKRIAATLITVAFGATLLAAPTTALSVPGNSCNPAAGHGTSGCHRVTATPVVSVPGTPTVASRPSGPASVRVRRNLTLTGTVSGAESTGVVTIVKTRLVGKKWKSAGSAEVSLVNGYYRYSFKPTQKGKWRFVAKFLGTWDGTSGYAASKSGVKNVQVK